LRIFDGVAADYCDAGFGALVRHAGEHGCPGFRRRESWIEAGDVHRRDRLAAHRINVRKRVGCCDCSVGIRIIDDRRKEVHRLDKRHPITGAKHTGDIVVIETDEDVGVRGPGQSAENLSELGWSQLARSTGAINKLS
jgi:hypothetical protein